MINFKAGDTVTVNQTYVEETLKPLARDSKLIATLERLGYCGTGPCKVIDTGMLTPPNEDTSFIQVLPDDIFSSGYHGGHGVTLFFGQIEWLNNAFTSASAAPVPAPVVEPEVVTDEAS